MTNLRKLQLTQLQLLQEVDIICKRYGLSYNLSDGTLLGAVRHKGFIPWDDDIDIEMPYAHYKKFCKICRKTHNKNKYFLQTMETDKHHPYVFAKFRMNNTLHIRQGQEHMKFHHGIYIDIFPKYPVPDNIICRTLYLFIIARCKTILWAPVGIGTAKGPFKKGMYKLISLIPNFIPKKIIYTMVNNCNGKYSLSLGAPSFGALKYSIKKLIVPKATLAKLHVKDMVTLPFEGQKFSAPGNYHQILTNQYGNYKKLPPKHKRVGHHKSILTIFPKSKHE